MTALVALGIGAVVLAIAPRAASGAVYSIVIWSLLVDLLASMVASMRWLDRTSLYHYMRLAPAQHLDLEILVIASGAAFALCTLATALFRRRDLL